WLNIQREHWLSLADESTPNRDNLTYKWEKLYSPNNTAVNLSPNDQSARVTFTPTVEGDYEFTLTVFGGLTTSPPVVAVVNVSSGNAPPMANAGQNFSVTLGTSVTLNGVASDPNNDPMTYRWVVNAMPTGGSATIANLLSNPNTLTPSFTAQALGTYVFGLIASDSTSSSQVSTVSVTTNSPTPTGPASPCNRPVPCPMCWTAVAASVP
ncbi:MAG: hypothetical protein QM527_12515, partial [Alphaproteobacteria bacterium]|nr:hypothetical protein [Alphaproteobacteria bacterium]